MDKNGGSAYPWGIATQDNNGQPLREYEVDKGMSLRDWFAGQALSGLPEHLKVVQTDHRIKIAEWTYGMADAMLAEREKGNA